MYKDYKKSESLDKGFVGGSGIMWMFSGIILGLLVGIGMYFFSNERTSAFSGVDYVQSKIEKAQSKKFVPVSKKSVQATAKKSSNSLRENKFSYYAVLPNLDVPINTKRPMETRVGYTPESVLLSKKKALISEDVLKEGSSGIIKQSGYLLQVASFKKMSKAKLTRGRLSKRGIDAYVQTKKVKGRLWYRVVAGPVDQRSVDSWKTTAEKLGHHPLIISVR